MSSGLCQPDCSGRSATGLRPLQVPGGVCTESGDLVSIDFNAADNGAVGWAERSEAQRSAAWMLGFAALSPTYAQRAVIMHPTCTQRVPNARATHAQHAPNMRPTRRFSCHMIDD